MEIAYIAFLAIGRLLIFIAEKFVSQNIKSPFLNWLVSCVLCSGVWLYTIMSFITGYIIFDDWIQVPIFSQIVTGCFSAYLVFLLDNGWKATHEVIVV